MRKWTSDLLSLISDVLWALIEPLIHRDRPRPDRK